MTLYKVGISCSKSHKRLTGLMQMTQKGVAEQQARDLCKRAADMQVSFLKDVASLASHPLQAKEKSLLFELKFEDSLKLSRISPNLWYVPSSALLLPISLTAHAGLPSKISRSIAHVGYLTR